jgi:putative flippase GtrA
VSGSSAAALGRYLAVGAVATAAHWALMSALVEVLRLPPWLASGAGAVAGAQLAFYGNRRYTFDHRGPLGAAWRRFMATALLGALVGMAVVAVGVAAGAHYLLAQALATVLGMLLTFVVNRGWTFGR